MNVVTIEAIFNSTKEKVWQAITDKEIMKIWYFDIPSFNLEVGADFSFYEGEKKEYLHTCKVLNFEENKLLQHTWMHPEQSKGSSVLTWKIDEVDEKVKVTLTHEGLENFGDAGPAFAPENYEMGWNALVKTNLRNYLYGIKKLVFSVEINATVDDVWNIMWDKNSYRNWVRPFCEGTYYTGEILQGNRIHFLNPNGSGMYSDVGYLVPNKLIIFSHLGNISNFEEQPIDVETEKWTGCFETYKYEEVDGNTVVTAEIDCVPEYVEYMNNTFPLALQELKNISEN